MSDSDRSLSRTLLPHQRRSERRTGIPLVGVALWVLASCGGEVTPGPTVEVRDSAGVTIVENHGAVDPSGSGWALATTATIELGSLSGPEESQLYRVRGAVRLTDGRIVVGNDGTRELKVFSSGGDFLESMGGEGEGPGEFTSIQLLGLTGDSLVVLDRRQKRVSLLHPNSGFVRSFPLEDAVGVYPMEGWLFGSGSVLIEDLPMSDSGVFEDGFNRTPVPYKSSDMTGALLTDFGSLPGGEIVTITRQSDHGLATMISSVPFGKSPVTLVEGDLLYYGSHDGYSIDILGSGGALERIVRLATDPVPVSDGDFAAYVEDDLAGFSDEEEARTRRQDLETMPRMEFRPPHGPIFADSMGTLFVADYTMPGQETVGVNVFDSEGKLTGRFEMAAGLEVLEIGTDYLLALIEDDLGVEYVRLYDLIRPH